MIEQKKQFCLPISVCVRYCLHDVLHAGYLNIKTSGNPSNRSLKL